MDVEFSNRLEDVVVELDKLGAVKLDAEKMFRLKGGKISPVYFDLRVVLDSPRCMAKVADILWRTFTLNVKPGEKVDKLCGVPYAALPLASLIAVNENLPMLVRRKEPKQHGTAKRVEGTFQAGQLCLVVEDVITSGSSVLEVVDDLRNECGLKVDHVVAFLDRQQGGIERLANNKIEAFAVTNVSTLMSILVKHGRISQEKHDKIMAYLEDQKNEPSKDKVPVTRLSFEERLKLSGCPISGRLFQIMVDKKSNLCAAADFTDTSSLCQFANEVGPYVCCLKTHVDIVADWDVTEGPRKLAELAEKHNFLLFEDRKLADIGSVTAKQVHEGPFYISKWASFVTVHGLPGPGLLDALKTSRTCKALIIAEMSSKGNLASAEYAKKCTSMALSHPSAVGLISQSRLDDEETDFIQMTPGVRMDDVAGDHLGQQYIGPEEAILNKGADIIIVGRGISQSPNQAFKANEYRAAGWNAYSKRIGK